MRNVTNAGPRYLEEALRISQWWLENRADLDDGGVYACTHPATGVTSDTKYVWAQGRWAWLMSALGSLVRAGDLPSSGLTAALQEHGRLTARLIADQFVSDSIVRGTVAPRPTDDVGGPPRGIFRTLFAAQGLAAGAALGDRGMLPLMERLLESARRQLAEGSVEAEPLPRLSGSRALAPYMICLGAALAADDAGSDMGRAVGTWCVERIISGFLTPIGLVEIADEETRDTGGYINTGHNLEALWFLLEATRRKWAPGHVDPRQLAELGFRVLAGSWDDEFGGLRRIMPSGTHGEEHVPGLADRVPGPDDKVWWVHAEALAALSYLRDFDAEVADAWSRGVWEFSERVFVRSNRDWEGVYDRHGLQPSEVESTSFVPLRDAFHQVRALMAMHAAMMPGVFPGQSHRDSEDV